MLLHVLISIVHSVYFILLQFYKKYERSLKISVNSFQPGIKPTGSFIVSYLSTIQLTYYPGQNRAFLFFPSECNRLPYDPDPGFNWLVLFRRCSSHQKEKV